MKLFILIILFFIPIRSFAQSNPYAEVDKYVMSIPQNTPLNSLAARLTEPFHTDSEKVRAIFYWITQNISYDVVKYHHKEPEISSIYTDSIDRENFYCQIYANATYKTRKGVCEDYASLFKVLCTDAGIECVKLTGAAKNDISNIGIPFTSNHAWNAVKIDSSWRLIDACWGSGYSDAGVTKFTKKFCEYYFFTRPEMFVYNHYPDDTTWLLMKELISKEEYSNYPYPAFDNPRFRIMKFAPQNGVVKAHVGETIRIEIELDKTDDTIVYKGSAIDEFNVNDKEIHPPKQLKKLQSFRVEGNHLYYEYKVWSMSVKALYVAYNLKYLFAYKLEVLKSPPNSLKKTRR